MFRILATAIPLACSLVAAASAQTPENFRRENLVAWCIVPFDARDRSPESRAAMLNELGLKRCAYDWRKRHVGRFEDEIIQYKKHGIEYFAFWNEHPCAFEWFRKHEISPQVWKTLPPDPAGEKQAEKLNAAVEYMLPLARRTQKQGLRLGLYNHGGWGGEPKNLVAVCKALHKLEFRHVGIVYNFHHGHGHIHDFEPALAAMKPHLFCLNLNGMVDLEDDKYRAESQRYKILPIGGGDHERDMIRTVIRSGYSGPVGILGHVADRDVAEVLQENLDGLQRILDDQ